jgi:hypothetical protein
LLQLAPETVQVSFLAGPRHHQRQQLAARQRTNEVDDLELAELPEQPAREIEATDY